MPSSRRSEKARRATPELTRSRCSAIRPRPSRCTLPAEWKSAETSASRQQPRAGAIEASSLRSSSESAMALQAQEPALVRDAERAVRADTAGPDDAMAREKEREPVARAEGADGALRAWVPCERGQVAVGDDLAPGHPPERVGDVRLEGR